jgi:O-antigen ligase
MFKKPRGASIKRLLSRKPTPLPGQTSHHTKRVWWLRGATGLVIGYVVASQALLELSGWSFLAVACAALLAGHLIIGGLLRISNLRFGRWVWIPVVFISYCLMRSFSGIKGTNPFDVLISVASAFLGGVAVAVALKAGVRFRWLVYAQVASNLLQIIIVLLGLGPAPVSGEDTFRYAGMTGNANALALQLTLGACTIWLLPRKAGLVPCLFAFGAVAFALAVTGSRKAVLVALFFLVLVCLQAANLLPQGRRRRLWLTLAVAVPCLLGLFLAPSVYQHGQDILPVQRTLEYQDSSYQTRAEMIQQGIRLWLQAPLFGNGLDSFRGLSGQDTYSHNNYVELLCGIGIVGTLLFYAIHAQVVIRAARARHSLRYYCWVFILTLLLADIGYVSYKSKQSIMILMVLTVVTSSRYALKHDHLVAERHAPALKDFKSRPRRFVLGT